VRRRPVRVGSRSGDICPEAVSVAICVTQVAERELQRPACHRRSNL